MSEKEALLAKLRGYAAEQGKTAVSRNEFRRFASEYKIMNHFESWNDFCHQAGLECHTNNIKLDDTTLFESMRQTFIRLGRVSTAVKFERSQKYSLSTYTKRWNGWNNVLLAFKKWVVENDPTFPFLNDLPDDRQVASVIRTESQVNHNQHKTWEPLGKRQYGEIVNFRGLQHAPINEQGVVLLFGMLAEELGYVVESVATGFPDCEAKRKITKANRWERVRIEFEFLSRNFREHGHDASHCELIVCWEHNWPDCPLEVLELKKVINTL